MDVFERDGGSSTADTVHRREEFRQIVTDVGELPETQRTALLLREIDALSYDQIAEAMDTTVPSVKSLLVRARVSLAEAAEARLLTCEEVRLELGQVAEGLTRTTAPLRRHLKSCDRCHTFRAELRKTTRALAAVYPLGPLVFFKKLWLAKAGVGGASAAGAAASGGAAAGSGGVAGVAMTAAGGITASGAVSAGVSTLASKAAAGVAAALIVTAGAVEVQHVSERQVAPAPQVAVAPSPAPIAPRAHPARVTPTAHRAAAPAPAPAPEPAAVEPAMPVAPAPAPAPAVEQPPPAPAGAGGRLDGDPPAARGGSGRAGRAARRAHRAGRTAARRARQRNGRNGRHASTRAARRRARRHEQPRAASSAAAVPLIDFEDFLKVDIRVGRVSRVEDFPEARKPAWKLFIDFGPELGEKRSSAQVTNYTRDELEGSLVVAVVNFPPRQIGPFMSEVLTLGVPDEDGNVILLRPTHDVPVGGRMF